MRLRASVRETIGNSRGDTERHTKQNDTLPISIPPADGVWKRKQQTSHEAPCLRERNYRKLSRRRRDTERQTKQTRPIPSFPLTILRQNIRCIFRKLSPLPKVYKELLRGGQKHRIKPQFIDILSGFPTVLLLKKSDEKIILECNSARWPRELHFSNQNK